MTATSKPFILPMVPPNLTGDLHLGHALMVSVQDCLIRFQQMRGEETMYIPGVDHAGIGMYAQVRANTDFLPGHPIETRLTAWADHYRQAIPEQFRSLDLACDWKRQTYTMDPEYIELVYHVFRRLAEDGLIYRDYKVVHWCPNCQTSLSDMECDRITRDTTIAIMGVRIGKRTELVESSQPELLWAAAALAVSRPPEIESISNPFDEAPLPVIHWERHGSKATFLIPAHNADHLAQARALGLPLKEALDGQGRSLVPKAYGISRQELRAWTITHLGLKTVRKPSDVLQCSRCQTELLARLSWQWFLRMRPLAQPIEAAIRNGNVHILPDDQKRQALDWLNRVEDWCISRQIPWGQRIPAHICTHCSGWTLAEQPTCSLCGSQQQHEQDVFDTWFSSALWPLAVANWPAEKGGYPASVLTTGKDILFFYLIRVYALNNYLTGTYPAPVSYLHGLVVDERGAKMSKSRGNSITLSKAVKQYGADTLRATLLSDCRGSYDVKFRHDRITSQQKVVEALHHLESLATQRLNPSADKLDQLLLACALEAEVKFADAINSYQFSTAVEVLRAFALGPLARFIAIRERQSAHESTSWSGLCISLLRRISRLFTPVMPTIASRLLSFTTNHEDHPEAASPGSTAASPLLASIKELERLRGAIGINTHTPLFITLPSTLARELDEPWVKYSSSMPFQIGEPLTDAIGWQIPERKDVVLYLPPQYALRLRKEALRQLRIASERRRLLSRHTEEALAGTPRAQQALPALQAALEAAQYQVEVLKENLAVCKK